MENSPCLIKSIAILNSHKSAQQNPRRSSPNGVDRGSSRLLHVQNLCGRARREVIRIRRSPSDWFEHGCSSKRHDHFPWGISSYLSTESYFNGSETSDFSIYSWRRICMWIRRLYLCIVVRAIHISIEYRLVPENPITSCYDDCWTALQWVLSHANEDGVEPWLNKHADFRKLFSMPETLQSYTASRYHKSKCD